MREEDDRGCLPAWVRIVCDSPIPCLIPILSTDTPTTNTQSTAHFQRGMSALLDFAKAGIKKNKDPAAAAQLIAKMAVSPDPAMKVKKGFGRVWYWDCI